MAKKPISKKEAEALLNKYKSKTNITTIIFGLVLIGLFWLSVAAAYKALILYLFGG